jgi:putative ABC transport system permease protein
MKNDLRYALRQLVRQPGFAIVALLTIGLGIAATTTMFSVVDAVLIHPLPYPHAERIVTVSQTIRSTGVSTQDTSPANFLDWSAQNAVFMSLAVSRGWQANLAGAAEPERIRTTMASSGFFSVFGVNPVLGRTFGRDDARPGAAHVAVLSYGLWLRRYGADRGIIGHDLILDGDKFTIIGVMPNGYSPDDYGEIWVPSPWDVPTHQLTPNDDPRQFRDRSYLTAWARLKPGVSLQQAQVEMNTVGQRLEQQYPNANQDTGVTVVPLREEVVGGIRPMLLMLLGAVCFVLLIGCANVANLLLARAAARSREIAIRTALGATRSRLIRQLLTESALLALLGGGVGLLIGVWALPVLLSLSPPEVGAFNGIGLNREVLAFSVAVSLLSGTLFGLAPAFFASRSDPNDSLREGERGSSRGRNAARSLLIAGEIALSLVLLVGAALLMKSFVRLTEVDPGFVPDRLLVFSIGLPSTTDDARQTTFYQQVIERVRALPGVQSVGAVSRLPLSGGNSSRSFNARGSSRSYAADIRVSTPDYFKAMGIPLLQGRAFTEQDARAALPVAVINQATAANVFPGQNPIGQTVENFGPAMSKLQIIGVVGNVRHVALEKAARPEIYLPIGQAQWPSMFVAVRSAVSNPLSLLPSVQKAVWSIDRNVPLASARTMNDMLARSVVRRKFAMALLSIFAGLATLLAAIGLYGVIAYSVAQRTKEIGIRIALGGQRADVLSMILGQSGRLVLLGIGVGLPAAVGASRLLGNLLFGLSAIDALTYLVVVAGLSATAFLASIIPAFRATRINPIVALRHE